MAPRKHFKDANDFNISEDDFDLALSLLLDACQSRLDIKYHHDPLSVRFYNQYFNKYLVRLYYFFMTANLLTILLEEPAAVLFDGKPLPYYIPLIINIICELYFFFRWLHIFVVVDLELMKKNISFWLSAVFIFLMVVDDITYIIQHCLKHKNPIRWSRLVRPALLLTFPENKRIRGAFENIRCTAQDVLSVFAMFMASLLFVSVVTMKVVDTKGMLSLDNEPYIPNFGEIAWELYVLTTTSNSPDIIIPAYEKHAAYIAIYVWVCVACNWLFMGILTASVYNAYKGHLGENVLKSLVKRKNILDEAFRILQSIETEEMVSREIFIALIQRVTPNRSENSIALIYDILDAKNAGIGQVEFARLTEYMQLNFREVVISRKHFERYLPRFYNIYISKWYQMIVRIIRSKPTHIFFDIMVVLNGVTLVVADGTPYEDYFEWTFTAIFALEILFKYLASGGVNFFQEKWNIFDMIIVIGAFVGQFINLLLEWSNIKAPSSLSQAFLLLRLFRLLKIIGQVPIFRCIINCIIIILPSLCAYATILLILFYIFTCVGMELFGGLLVIPSGYNYTVDDACKNNKLAGSSFLQLHYCDLHFNDAASSFVTLFVLSVGNNWHIITDGFTRITNKSYRLYFLCIHWMCVLLVLNIVLAFIIEAFLIEYDPQESRFEEFIRKRMRELGVDAETELEKRGLERYRENEFYVTREQLDAAFPPHLPDIPFSAFFFIPDSASIELLMFRMFETEIEAIATNYHERRTIRVNAANL
ncbi:Two pore calcium channel protein 2 [Echinococcus granulosus]|nr:Two pore calcium channel protein 2 [Echinococcus granulosus]